MGPYFRLVLRYSRVADAIKKLLGLGSVVLRDPEGLTLALAWYERGLDFAGALHLAKCQDMDRLLTFDQNFVKRAEGHGTLRRRPVATAKP